MMGEEVKNMLSKSEAQLAMTKALEAADEVLLRGSRHCPSFSSAAAVATIAVQLIKLCGPEEF